MNKLVKFFFLIIVPFLFSANLSANSLSSHNNIDSLRADTIKYWKTGGGIVLNISQIALSNWAAGGENLIAGNSMMNLYANYKKEKTSWDNTIDFAFGRLKKESTKAIKNDDRFEFTTKYGRKRSDKWYYSGMLNIKTQFFPGYKFPEKDSIKISDFLSPAYILLSAGMDYKPSDKFTFLMSPVTGKVTIVNSPILSSQKAYGVEQGKNTRSELGGFFKIILKGSLFKNLNYQTKVDAFLNYMNNPENIDWDCEFLLGMSLNKYISANLKTNLLYDDDVVTLPNTGPKLQLKEFLGVGFSYKI
jgi:hypothetical protein